MRQSALGIALVAVAVVGMAGLVEANATHDRLLKLSDKERHVLWTLYMREGGENCVVKEDFFQGMSKNGVASWNVRCTNGNTFSIGIDPDAGGSMKMLECSFIKFMGGGECFKKFEN